MSNLIKEFHFDEQGRDKLLSGIKTIAKSVKSTLGPRGKTVIIESPHHTRGITVTKDGVTVAKAVTVEDPVESLAIQIIREASENTAVSAGDGTTTSIVMAEAMVECAMNNFDGSINTWTVVEHINKYARIVEEKLIEMSRPITGESIVDIASISANNDRSIGQLIADAYSTVGRNGLVTIQNSQDESTYIESTPGIKIDRGYASVQFANNHKRDECILTDEVYVLMTDIELSTPLQIEVLLKSVVESKKKLLIIAPTTVDFNNLIAMNVVKNKFGWAVIEPPQFGYKSAEMMGDIAVATGGVFFSQSTGDDLSLATIDDLGVVSKAVINRDKTTLIPMEGSSKELDDRVAQLSDRASETKDKKEKDFLNERVAVLKGGVSTIFVGGNSDVEQKEKYDRIEDAVCAVRSAIEEGVVIGGGYAIKRAVESIEEKIGESDKEDMLAFEIIGIGCYAPCVQIMKNAEYTKDQIKAAWDLKGNEGIDIRTGNIIQNMFASGIVDPLKVTRNAFKNAVSVVTTILNTNAIITIKRDDR